MSPNRAAVPFDPNGQRSFGALVGDGERFQQPPVGGLFTPEI